MKKGFEVEITSLVKCDFCGKDAQYDARTITGAWAYMCVKHFGLYGIGLGVGKGQRLVMKGENYNVDNL